MHIPVLLKETINYLTPKSGKTYVDGTLGNGGHAEKILAVSSPKGKLIGIDQDKESLEIASKRLSKFKNRVIYINDNFRNLKKILNKLGIAKVDGILLDLGISTYQLESKRGFSFSNNQLLDMRMDKSQSLTAEEIINHYSESELVKIIKEQGEEPYAKKIASAIVKQRQQKKIKSTNELVEIIKKCIPPEKRYKQKKHFATSTFRAFRMTVNDELGALKDFLNQSLSVLNKNSQIVIISFHSLEDRIVKNFLKDKAKNCICPPKQPICNCGHRASLKILTKKAITPSTKELSKNPKSRSAKLRAAQIIN